MSEVETKVAETKVIVGVCAEISEKNGWTSFAIEVGSQYPIRLSTKVQAIIDSARAVGNQKSAWTYKESPGGENPNRPGTHYINRRLEKVESADGQQTLGPIPTSSSSSSEDKMSKEDWNQKDKRIARESVLKTAASILAVTGIKPEEDPVLVTLKMAERLETWVYRGFGPTPFEQAKAQKQETSERPGAYDEPDIPSAPEDDYSDIPF